MGLTTINGRRYEQMNDNDPHAKRGPEDVHIPHDEWRHPPHIEKEEGVKWYCVVTVPQQEYACCDGLSDAGVISYVPTETKWVQRRKARELVRTQIQTPIFRSYVFIRIARDSDWEPIYTTKMVRPESDADADWLFGLSDDDRRYVEMLRLSEAKVELRRNPHHILGVIGVQGKPMAMPIEDLIKIADEERAGWFNEDMRPTLLKAERIANLKAAEAERARQEEQKPKPDFMAGEEVRITAGWLADETAVAENDNDRGVVRLLHAKLGRVVIPISDLENLTRPKIKAGELRRASA